MMTLLINNEMPELEQRKNAIMLENFESMAELTATEDKILNALEGGDISKFLENDDLIDQLKESKTKSEEISQKIEESKETTIKIDKERENWQKGKFGLGCLQWRGERTYTLYKLYEQECNNPYNITIDQATKAEGNMIINEFNGNYKYVYDQ